MMQRILPMVTLMICIVNCVGTKRNDEQKCGVILRSTTVRWKETVVFVVVVVVVVVVNFVAIVVWSNE